MAKITTKPKIDIEVTMTLTLHEALALEALAGYGTKEFLACFYKNMGRSYLEPHAEGIESLFVAARGFARLRDNAPKAERVLLGMSYEETIEDRDRREAWWKELQELRANNPAIKEEPKHDKA